MGTGVANTVAVEAATGARPSLADEQREMVRRLALSGNSVDIVVGRPGSGKTFALDAVRAAYEASEYRVLGTALAARAAKELEAGSGIPSRTAASLQSALASGLLQLDSRSVVVIDEAGMVGTRMLAALVAEANSAGAKVIAVGDPKQLPEIQAGGLFRALASRLGEHELTGNRRQRDPVERIVLADLRAGRVDAAVGRLVERGHVTVSDNADLVRDAMVTHWLQATVDGRDAVMLGLRRDDVDDLNDRARHALIRDGRLGPEVLAVDDVRFAVGDRVLAHRNRYDLGLLNGDTGVVRGATKGRLLVDIDGGRSVEVPVDYLSAGHLGHAYARTIHKAQGMTCDEALLLGSEELFAEAGYTGLSRGRLRNHLYTVASGQELEDHAADDPLARVRQALSASHTKTAAMDLVAQV